MWSCLGLALWSLATSATAFTHVNVVDVQRGSIQADMTVIVSGDRIVAVAHTTPSAADTAVIDARNKYIIPGLWDMHVHWYERRNLSLFIANGVTGVRQMWGRSSHFEFAASITKGELAGPRQVVASPIVDGPNPVWPGSLVVDSTAEARETVTRLRREGFAFIKVYEVLSRDAYFALAIEAKKQGVPLIGHVPNLVTALEASNAGHRSIEHATNVLLACSSAEQELLPEIAKRLAEWAPENTPQMNAAIRAAIRPLTERALATYDDAKAKALFASFSLNDTAVCPTLTAVRPLDWVNRWDVRDRYVPHAVREEWRTNLDAAQARSSPTSLDLRNRVFRKEMSFLPMAQAAGVRILAGTDALNPYCLPGFSLPDELELLVEAGLSPLQALQAATIHPAAHLGRSATMGTVTEGKVADLVLLDANPLDDIANTRRVFAVVAAGRVYSRAALDRLLAEAEQFGAELRKDDAE